MKGGGSGYMGCGCDSDDSDDSDDMQTGEIARSLVVVWQGGRAPS